MEDIDVKNTFTEEEETALAEEAKRKEGESEEDYSKRIIDTFKKSRDKGYKQGAQRRIDDAIRKAREAEERATAIEEENRRLKEEGAKPSEITEADVIVAGGKKWYSDRALSIMVDKGELSEDSKSEYIRKRDRAAITDDVKRSLKEESAKEEEIKIRKQDSIEAKEKYPFLNDPDSPEYKVANRLWKAGLHSNPRGLSEAGRLTEEYFKRGAPSDEDRNRRSRELGVEEPSSALKKKTEKVTLTAQEKEWSHQNFKNLSPEKAEEKALKAKKRRLGVE